MMTWKLGDHFWQASLDNDIGGPIRRTEKAAVNDLKKLKAEWVCEGQVDEYVYYATRQKNADDFSDSPALSSRPVDKAWRKRITQGALAANFENN